MALPPVREIREDIPAFAQVLLAQLAESRSAPARRFSPAALEVLQAFDWTGNLEDIATAVRTLAVTAAGEEIAAGEVGPVLAQFDEPPPPAPGLDFDQPLREARDTFERLYFEHHLAAEGGSIARVAEKSGQERTHLYRKLKALGIATGKKETDSWTGD